MHPAAGAPCWFNPFVLLFCCYRTLQCRVCPSLHHLLHRNNASTLTLSRQSELVDVESVSLRLAVWTAISIVLQFLCTCVSSVSVTCDSPVAIINRFSETKLNKQSIVSRCLFWWRSKFNGDTGVASCSLHVTKCMRCKRESICGRVRPLTSVRQQRVVYIIYNCPTTVLRTIGPASPLQSVCCLVGRRHQNKASDQLVHFKACVVWWVEGIKIKRGFLVLLKESHEFCIWS